MTNRTADATVTVLTAEVRALMVGARQVTLSVFRQLDEIPWDRIAPFGRVNPGYPGYSGERRQVWTVGRMVDGAALVRSHMFEPVSPKLARANGFMDYPRDPGPRLRAHIASHHGLTVDEYYELEYAKRRDYWAEWRALPLIVLAGLR